MEERVLSSFMQLSTQTVVLFLPLCSSSPAFHRPSLLEDLGPQPQIIIPSLFFSSLLLLIRFFYCVSVHTETVGTCRNFSGVSPFVRIPCLLLSCHNLAPPCRWLLASSERKRSFVFLVRSALQRRNRRIRTRRRRSG